MVPRKQFFNSAFVSCTSFGRSTLPVTNSETVSRRITSIRSNTPSLPCSFFGASLPYRLRFKSCQNYHHQKKQDRKKLCMLVDPWSVSPDFIDKLSAQLFATSLFPYLTFLYFLNQKNANCPSLVNFGFRFLLVFVFATIPAGIYAKVHYHDILANIDWLHGSAESLLTITNILIVIGFRNFYQNLSTKLDKESQSKGQEETFKLNSFATTISVYSLATVFLSMLGYYHAEPNNALSFPTWVIHVSSVIEWLVAMGYVWQYSNVCQNPRWKGLTWGMLPLHTSSICACTYHLFYNSPSLNILVALQALLTCVGNGTMAFATYRISKFTPKIDKQLSSDPNREPFLISKQSANVDIIDKESNNTFVAKLFLLSALISVGIKWGSLFVDFPFQPSLAVALAIIFTPSVYIAWKYNNKTQNTVSKSGS